MPVKKEWTEQEDAYLKVHYGYRTIQNIADDLGIAFDTASKRINQLKLQSQWQKEYAVYIEDDFIMYGNRAKVMREMNITEDAFRLYKSNVGRERGCRTIILELGMWPKDGADYEYLMSNVEDDYAFKPIN